MDHLTSLISDLAAQPDERSAVARAVDLATKAVKCVAADAIAVQRSSGIARLVASSDPAFSDAMGTATTPAPGSSVRSSEGMGPDLTRLVFPVLEDDSRLMMLRFFSPSCLPFTTAQIQTAARFAGSVVPVIDRARLRSQVLQLQRAVVSNRTIGVAIGIVVATLAVPADRAYELLRRRSQDGNRKLVDVAEEVVADGCISSLITPHPGVGVPG